MNLFSERVQGQDYLSAAPIPPGINSRCGESPLVATCLSLPVASFTIMSQRDIDRFERLILPHLDDAYTLARYLLRDEHDAQDVVQEATLRALRYFDGYAGGDGRAWLLSIVRNSVADFARKERAWDSAEAGATDSLAASDQSDALAIE